MFDPFEVEEVIGRANAKIAEMGLAEDRLNKAVKRAQAATKAAKDAEESLGRAVAGARSQERRSGGRKW